MRAFESSQGPTARERKALRRVEGDMRSFLRSNQPEYEETEGVGVGEDLMEWIRIHAAEDKFGTEIEAWEQHRVTDEQLVVDLEQGVTDEALSASWLQDEEADAVAARGASTEATVDAEEADVAPTDGPDPWAETADAWDGT